MTCSNSAAYRAGWTPASVQARTHRQHIALERPATETGSWVQAISVEHEHSPGQRRPVLDQFATREPVASLRTRRQRRRFPLLQRVRYKINRY